jgi:hypothetical protein
MTIEKMECTNTSLPYNKLIAIMRKFSEIHEQRTYIVRGFHQIPSVKTPKQSGNNSHLVGDIWGASWLLSVTYIATFDIVSDPFWQLWQSIGIA